MEALELLSKELLVDYSNLEEESVKAGLSALPVAEGAGLLFPGDPQEPLVIYYPGEWESVSHLLELARGMAGEGLGLAVWLGAGASGEIQPPLWLDRAAAFAQGVIDAKRPQEGLEKAVFMGCSLGCAAAIHAANVLQDRALCMVLEAAFVDTWPYLEAKGVLRPGVPHPEDPFANRAKMREFKPAVLFLQSQRDPLVPPSALEWLVCESRSKATQFQICPGGGREDIREAAGPLYYDMIHRFINLRLGRRPKRIGSWRERRRGHDQ